MAILEDRIRPILGQELNVEVNEIEKVIPPLAKLAIAINTSNKWLSSCNVKIVNMIDSCQL